MKTTKTHPVVILDTEKASYIKLAPKGEFDMHRKLERDELFFANEFSEYGYPSKHIYIISDEEIKEEDYAYHQLDGKIIKVTKENIDGDIRRFGYKKIIASTDKSLGLPDNYTLDQLNLQIPQIPESFIKVYIEAYNNGKPITEVDLEYEELSDDDMLRFGLNVENDEQWFRLKTRSDNTVIIHQSKTYTRDDMKAAFRAGMELEKAKGNSFVNVPGFDKFINNLK